MARHVKPYKLAEPDVRSGAPIWRKPAAAEQPQRHARAARTTRSRPRGSRCSSAGAEGTWPAEDVGWVDGHHAQHGRRAPPSLGRLVGLAGLDPPYNFLFPDGPYEHEPAFRPLCHFHSARLDAFRRMSRAAVGPRGEGPQGMYLAKGVPARRCRSSPRPRTGCPRRSTTIIRSTCGCTGRRGSWGSGISRGPAAGSSASSATRPSTRTFSSGTRAS